MKNTKNFRKISSVGEQGKDNWKFSTQSVHAGEKPDPLTGAVAPVLVRSKTFDQGEFGVEGVYQYSRGRNPTREKLEEKLVALEAGGSATVFSTGVAAEACFFLTLSPGDHILFCQEIYGGTFRLLSQLMNRFGLEYDFVDFNSEQSIRAGIKKNTKYLFLETPTNPSLHVIDLKLVNKISKEFKIPFVVDATFSPPCATRHFEYGAETIIHSLSKYISGHNDILGGAVITKNKELHDKLVFLQKTVGAILSPDECYRILQEVKTLELRWQRTSHTAQMVAQYLSRQSGVQKVFYPGLRTHKNHHVAKRQTKGGFGAVISFVMKNEKFEVLKKFVSIIREHSPIIYGESLASPETILAYPPLMSHKSFPKNIRESLGITDGFFRLSVGLEDPEDIIRGLNAGFEAIRKN